uniref:Uncharacterized protein n=1 Tax=Arundo donax TaxID=35708 RepID=A0A0A9C9Y4_ARUDO
MTGNHQTRRFTLDEVGRLWCREHQLLGSISKFLGKLLYMKEKGISLA